MTRIVGRSPDNWILEFKPDGILKDYTGQKFGYFTVVRYAGTNKKGRIFYYVEDYFGNTDIVSSASFYRKTFGSRLINRKSIRLRKLIHAVHHSMMYRCYRDRTPEYSSYGGRGIRVCDEWLGKQGREAFTFWMLRNGWKPRMSINRKDINGPYSPDNCEVISIAENAKYRSTTKLSYSIAESIREAYNQSGVRRRGVVRALAAEHGVSVPAIYKLLNGRSWS